MDLDKKIFLTEVINRMTSIGDEYIKALKELNEHFPCDIVSGFNSNATKSTVKFSELESTEVKLKSNPLIKGNIIDYQYDNNLYLQVKVKWENGNPNFEEDFIPIDKVFYK